MQRTDSQSKVGRPAWLSLVPLDRSAGIEQEENQGRASALICATYSLSGVFSRDVICRASRRVGTGSLCGVVRARDLLLRARWRRLLRLRLAFLLILPSADCSENITLGIADAIGKSSHVLYRQGDSIVEKMTLLNLFTEQEKSMCICLIKPAAALSASA